MLFLRHRSIIILYFQIALRGAVTAVEKEMFVKCLLLTWSYVYCKGKEISDMKMIYLSRARILWRVLTQARKVCYICKDQQKQSWS